jgi:trimeric autotransporter adhesin
MKKIVFAILILFIMASTLQAFPQYSNELVYGLVAYWNLNEGIGVTTADVVGINTGTITNATWTPPGKTQQGAGADSGNCLTFSSITGCYVDCGNDSSLNTPNQITIAGWIKPTNSLGGVGYDRILTKSNSDMSVSGSWLMQCEPSGKLSFGCAWANDTYTGVSTSTIVTDGVWYHIVATYDGANIRIYTNGIIDCTPVAKVSTIKNSTDHVFIGTVSDKQAITFFDGSIDGFAIWSRALSATEVSKLYKQAKNSKGVEALTNLLIANKVPYGLAWVNE